MSDREKTGLNRRDFLRRAAATTAAAAWAAPVIQTIAATPAFASTNGTPRVGCFHSPDEDHPDPAQSCMDTCTGKCDGITDHPGDRCDGFGDPDGPCGIWCNISPGNQCPNSNFCNPDCFTCNESSVTFTCSTA
ncbi:MAG: twin-arginine translocation signal domain-containing protein [Actinomycetota bacterium]